MVLVYWRFRGSSRASIPAQSAGSAGASRGSAAVRGGHELRGLQVGGALGARFEVGADQVAFRGVEGP
jgi:hypothetical protein